MSTLEFVLVAHAIIVGLAVAQILRGLAELIRADGVKVSYRLLFLSPFVFDAIIPVVFASQIGIAVLAIIAVYVKSPYFHIFVIAAMLAQVFWRGMSQVVGN